ncbi:hypothetical protein FVE67_01415 [Thermosulfurimonas marina]|uniref:J domain-containing protein n=1 Tax=Thermosulfurimonas marina TaxID=2047767 RepID=A0A6H1WQV1_9BACT|nr:hypothetical protein [Thermosulfurimonas marina]QJA05534.1 hypothetical protein FVE67_01415 [Thermosulfurimonas marina]
MYLARKRTPRGFRYSLRVSEKGDRFWRSREIFDLGEDPARYIRYPGGVTFYVDPELEEELHRRGVETDQWELERLFLRFVSPEIREKLWPYITRSEKKAARPSRREQMRLQETFHPFDKRRLIFLKFGGFNPRLLERPLWFLNRLRDKSRDEIEQLLWEMEDRLRPREVVSYIYAAFALWDYFPERLTRFIPEARLQRELDQAFLTALCELARDEAFRMGLSEEEVLREYLSRYVILYFDTTEGARRMFEERRAGRWARAEALHRAARYFGLSPETLSRLSRKELLRLFRERAKVLHPDRGGNKEAFVELRAIFEELMEALGYRRRL